ncbi:MAG: hemin uptake protein HemP [Pseudomonadota bacterium]
MDMQNGHQVNAATIHPIDDQLGATPLVDSIELLRGSRELRIRHGVSTYRLRLTSSDKLILTK